ncbi:hypothetical protein CX042_15300 [Bordetella pertussis]|nr:hypothetical protein UN82_04300 [Bordetella pertussis]ALX25970.1 hypothetical protein RD18_15075 [Bordetella pertussis]AMG22480.1 hypothetical protein AL474_09235 [Bordetella pertussis]AMS50557.1 hypothetical protein RD08_04310 [Bordetella pertussis]AMS54196.1 hypothetical protein RD09_04435 [Bordetella pertussis]
MTAVAAMSSLMLGRKLTWLSASACPAFHMAMSTPPSGEPRYPETKPAVFRPRSRSSRRCVSIMRTSACVPVRNTRPLVRVRLSPS